MLHPALIALTVAVLCLVPALQAESNLYASKVKPILTQHCTPCHGADKQKGKLRLDLKAEAVKPAVNGRAVIVPGKPEASDLVHKITLPREHDDVMPPANRPVMPDAEILLLTKWVREGAAWPEEKAATAAAPAPASAATPAPAADRITYTGQIKAIFDDRCTDCHSEDKQKGGLRMDSYAWIFKGAHEGKAVVVPGKPDQSSVYVLTTKPADDIDLMPPKGGPLSADQIALVRGWIEQGAKE